MTESFSNTGLALGAVVGLAVVCVVVLAVIYLRTRKK